MRRLLSSWMLCWMLLLTPGAMALDLAQPQGLLPACCRTHGAHHCSMMAMGRVAGPGWQAPGCPYAHLQRAALVLPQYLAAASPVLMRWQQAAGAPSARLAALAVFLAGLPASRAPPVSL